MKDKSMNQSEEMQNAHIQKYIQQIIRHQSKEIKFSKIMTEENDRRAI